MQYNTWYDKPTKFSFGIALLRSYGSILAICGISTLAFFGLFDPGAAMHPALQIGNKSNKTTLVSALYNINRHDRPFQAYRPWVEDTLQIRLPMVLFTTAANLPWIRAARSDLPTLFITEEDIPLEHLSEKVHTILSGMKNSDRTVEWTNKRYIPLQFSKAVWLQRAIALNPFDSDVFFWVDAGLSRFFQNGQPHTSFPLLESSKLLQHKVYLTATESFKSLSDWHPKHLEKL